MDERWDHNTDAGEGTPPAPPVDEPSRFDPPERPAAPPPVEPNGLLTPDNYSSPLPPPGLTPPPSPAMPIPPQQAAPGAPLTPPPGACQPPQPPVPQYPPQHMFPPQPPQYPQQSPTQWQQPTYQQPWQPVPPAPAVVRPIPGAIEHEGETWLPAGLAPRVVAFLIDGFLLALAGQVLVLAAGVPQPDVARVLDLYMKMWSELLASGMPGDHTMVQLSELMRPAQLIGWLNVAMCFCYYTAFHWLAGGTLGKLCLGLRVLRRDGSRLSLGWAALRYLGYFLCAKLVYTAWFVPLNPEKRTLYDLVLSTNVFKMKR